MYEVTSDVPIPTTEARGRPPIKDTLTTLEPGQSFEIPHEDVSKLRSRISTIHRQKEKRFTTRTTEAGMRIWRTV